MEPHLSFLPGIPVELVLAALTKAAGNEIESGKLASPESSAALAANAFGWFLEKPELLNPFPGTEQLGWPARTVDIEWQMRFPWRGGRHPWLDAGILTESHLIGVESKRFEPFRDRKAADLSPAYDREEAWGSGMAPWQAMRDSLRAQPMKFRHLDAAQLVKHALGLKAEARRHSKAAQLVYLYAEPRERNGTAISPEAHGRHRDEIAGFAAAVQGADVGFAACSYREWLAGWTGEVAGHANRLIQAFNL